MRWIFISLVALNALLAAWQFALSQGWSEAPQAPPPKVNYRPPAGVDPIRLLSEMPAASASSASSLSAPSAVVDAQTLCLMLGPFSEIPKAEAAIKRLEAADINAKIKAIATPVMVNYLVYLPPLATTAAAEDQLKALKTKDIDGQVITKGELRNGLALGAFEAKAAAKKRLAQLQKKGLEARMRSGEQLENTELWLALAPNNQEKLGDELKQSLAKTTKSFQERQILCSAIASP